jgi:hypothetical protein
VRPNGIPGRARQTRATKNILPTPRFGVVIALLKA